MAVDVRLRSSGVPRRMGAAAFTLASTVESAFGGYSHRVTAVYGTEPIPAPLTNVSQLFPVPPGPTGIGSYGGKHDRGCYWPTWSVIAHALPFRTKRPKSGGYGKPLSGGFEAATPSATQQNLVVVPNMVRRTGAGQARVTTAPKPTLNWKRQGG